MFWKGKMKYFALLQNFGEICVMTYHDTKHGEKLSNQGIAGIWVGYRVGHPLSTYRMLNPKR